VGDEAIERLYREHGHHVLRRARRLLASEDESREVLQEIFVSLLARPEQFDRRSSFTTWLYSATTHLCLNRIRDRKNRARLLSARAPAQGEDAPDSAEDRTLVTDLLAKLPDEIAKAAVYYHLDEMTQDETAAIMGCSRRHVGDLLERLTTWLKAQEGDT
jgi:RNA polymerase sigma factor (sigma-70 family)